MCLGKPFLGKAGYLSGYDAFLDWHPWNYTKVNYLIVIGQIHECKYHFTGRTCHGNSPWHGRSALDGAMLQGHAVEIMREHMYPGCPPDAANTINYTFVTTGPEFPSVVPDYTTAWYIGRFITTEDMEKALERITKCAEAAAMATETEVERELVTATHHKIPNRVLAECMYSNMVQVGAPDFSSEEHKKAKAIQRELGQPETGMPTEIEPFEGGYTVLCDTPEYSRMHLMQRLDSYGDERLRMAPLGSNKMRRRYHGTKEHELRRKGYFNDRGRSFMLSGNPGKGTCGMDRKNGRKTISKVCFDDMEPPVNLNKDTMYKYR